MNSGLIIKFAYMILFFLAHVITISPGRGRLEAVDDDEEMLFEPAKGAGGALMTEYRWLDVGETELVAAVRGQRRLAEPFQLCLVCKCCSITTATNCATMPCCFGIDCRLPNKPFGVCSFVPKTCNCTSCATNY